LISPGLSSATTGQLVAFNLHTEHSQTCPLVVLFFQIFFTFWQGFIISVLHYFGVLGEIGGWDSAHVSDGLQVGWIIAFLLNIHQVAPINLLCLVVPPQRISSLSLKWVGLVLLSSSFICIISFSHFLPHRHV
jgi:hypothetical protein